MKNNISPAIFFDFPDSPANPSWRLIHTVRLSLTNQPVEHPPIFYLNFLFPIFVRESWSRERASNANKKKVFFPENCLVMRRIGKKEKGGKFTFYVKNIILNFFLFKPKLIFFFKIRKWNVVCRKISLIGIDYQLSIHKKNFRHFSIFAYVEISDWKT